ncbi:MAG: PEP-CTERM sorting domain-containing protein [Sedimentisphaerales bacterium]|nr:PEP-CTERM sorting domain-containing protein [Sedimentisphaerales bacterium]
MRVYYNKTLRALCLLLLILLLVQTASALLTSSHYNGYVYFDVPWGDEGGTLNGVIEFAVYDNRSEYESNTGLTAPGEGDYIYAYKIWNTLPTSDEAVAYFSILGLDENEITGFGYDDDGGNAEPQDAYFDSGNGVWEWSIDNGFIQLGDNSWLLVFSSDYDWVTGEYEIRGIEESDFPEPGDGDGDVPEPSLVALFGLGGAALLRRRKQS